MKLGAVVLIIVFAVMSINHAVADRRYNRHYNNHYRGHGHHYNKHRGHGYYSYGPRRYYGHYDSHGDYVAYALGGLIVGGILGATLTSSYNNETRYSNYREPVYVNPNPASNAVQPSYVLQPNGICYVVSQVSNGNLVLSPVSPGNCQ